MANICITRSTTSSLYFGIGFATLFANIDEELDINASIHNANTTEPILPDRPAWWFYNFRMYSQLILLLFNVAKCIYSVTKNDTNNAILSAVRSTCVIGILLRHYYVCNYKFMDLVHGKLTPHLVPLQIMFMLSYNVMGGISAGIDSYFAYDRNLTMMFFLFPIIFRPLSFATAALYSKMMTKTAADGTMVVQEISSYMIMSFYSSLFFIILAGSDSTSKFFTDRLLTGIFFTLPFFSILRSLMNRKKKQEQIFIEHSQSLNESVLYDCKDDEEDTERFDRVYDMNNNNNNTGTVPTAIYDHKLNVLELHKQLTHNKTFALITPVACTFMFIMAFELAMSMYIYHRDGIPANWCEPFSFSLFDRGFQVVLDYFL